MSSRFAELQRPHIFCNLAEALDSSAFEFQFIVPLTDAQMKAVLWSPDCHSHGSRVRGEDIVKCPSLGHIPGLSFHFCRKLAR